MPTVDAAQRSSLTRWNWSLAALHLAQAIAMIALSTDRSLPVTGAFATGPPGQPLQPVRIEQLFDYRLGWAVALFMLLSAAFHAIAASPLANDWYMRELANERNRLRWVEYSLSSSVMIVIIAGLVGITDIAALLAMFAVNAAMILFGWLMETTTPARPARSWTPFIFGCIAGVAPWVAITIYLVGAGSSVPGFVYGIFVSMFVLFNCFALVQVAQYRSRGRWSDYLRGERTYMVLSLAAKSLLAWQVFANVLI